MLALHLRPAVVERVVIPEMGGVVVYFIYAAQIAQERAAVVAVVGWVVTQEAVAVEEWDYLAKVPLVLQEHCMAMPAVGAEAAVAPGVMV